MKNNHRKEWESILFGGCSGAGNRDRTGTRLPSRDFKSRASANSATPAQAHGRVAPVRIFIIARLLEKSNGKKRVANYFPKVMLPSTTASLAPVAAGRVPGRWFIVS